MKFIIETAAAAACFTALLICCQPALAIRLDRTVKLYFIVYVLNDLVLTREIFSYDYNYNKAKKVSQYYLYVFHFYIFLSMKVF